MSNPQRQPAEPSGPRQSTDEPRLRYRPARDQSDGLPILYTPEEVGKRLGRSGWWVREQCRRDRFPHTRAAGAIRFTRAQFDGILQILERRPEPGQGGGGTAVDGRSYRRARQPGHAPAVQLQARTPRRMRASHGQVHREKDG